MGYVVFRTVQNTLLLPPGGILGPEATGYTDFEPMAGLVCYLVLPLADNPLRPLGLSDLLCTVPQTRSPTDAPQNFMLKLNESHVAELTWSAAPGGAVGSYLLFTTDGPPTLLAGGITRTTRAAPSFTCYLLVALRGGTIGNTDVLCGLPGIATLADRR